MIRDLGLVFDPKFKSRKHLIEFTLANYPQARNVYVVDDFCCWFPGAQPMKRQGRVWKLITSLYEGDYRYAYVVDGYKWIIDPDNPEKAKNPYGMKCSLFEVGKELLSASTARNDGKIQLKGLYHDQTPQYLDVDENHANFRFRAKKDDVTYVALALRGQDDYEEEVEMEKAWKDKYFEYYECSIYVKKYPLKYFFKVKDADVLAYFSVSGSSYNEDAITEFALDEKSMNVFQVPSWAKGAVFYQIFPDRFYNGDRQNDPPKVAKWDANPTRSNFFGGDLQGVIQKLDYLERLGVNAIYLTPIFSSISNHKYDIYDYFKVDPHFGSNETLKSLVKEAHKRGIKVILDAVFHHTSDRFWAFQDLLKNQEKSKYASWYFIRNFPLKKRTLIESFLKHFPSKLQFWLRLKFPPRYETFAGVSYMPKLNLLNDETAEYFMKVAEYWIREVNIDGWRFDVAFGIPYEFWKKLRARLKRVKPDVYLLGEFGNGNSDPSAWIGSESFDAVMNYPLRSIILDFVVFEKIDVEDFHQRLMNLLGKLPKKALHTMYNLLGSHDTPRLLTVCKDDVKKAKLAILLQMTLPGAPAIYYGDEIGLHGRSDPDCRRTMVWDMKKRNLELLSYCEKLIKIRKEHPALAIGDLNIKVKDKQRNICVFERTYKNDFVIICINNNIKETAISVQSNELLLEAFSKRHFEPQNGVVIINVPPKEGVILLKNS